MCLLVCEVTIAVSKNKNMLFRRDVTYSAFMYMIICSERLIKFCGLYAYLYETTIATQFIIF